MGPGPVVWDLGTIDWRDPIDGQTYIAASC